MVVTCGMNLRFEFLLKFVKNMSSNKTHEQNVL